MPTALVLSAGGMFAAWEVGVWKALRERFRPDLIVGASAGALNGWAIAGGATPDELCREWMDPRTDIIRLFRHGTLHAKARELAERFQPKMPFGLTIAEVPRLRLRVVSEGITWRHLAAACAIPLIFRPVRIDGKYFVDGGLLGALPLWAAEQMGATEAIALNCLKDWPFRMFRTVLPVPDPTPKLRVTLIEPERPLASLRHAVRWSAANVERWIELGERDGKRALSSITM